jgi:hypothetical protein
MFLLTNGISKDLQLRFYSQEVAAIDEKKLTV